MNLFQNPERAPLPTPRATNNQPKTQTAQQPAIKSSPLPARSASGRGAGGEVALLVALLLIALLTGCAHETTTTTVHSNGSWTRKSVYSLAESEAGKGTKKLNLKDVFTPPAAPGWKVEQKITGDDPKQTVITAVKEVGPGETVTGDLTVKSPGKKGQAEVRVVNSATVRPAGPSRWVYTETFHWTGPKPIVTKEMEPLVRPSVKKALPAGFATDANARALGLRMEQALWKTLFSPPEPLMLDFYANLLPIPGVSDPDERSVMLVRRLGPGIETALFETFGNRMSRELRHQTAIKLARQINDDTGEASGKGAKMGGTAGKSPGADQATESFGGMYPAAVSVAVKMPGRVVETNGLKDDLTGEIYWTLFPQAALEHDVTLRAVFDAKGIEQATRH